MAPLRGAHRTGQNRLVAAGRLQRDQNGSERSQALDKHRPAVAVARDGKSFVLRPAVQLQPILGHINPDKMLHVPSLRKRARPAALRLFELKEPADGAPLSATGL